MTARRRVVPVVLAALYVLGHTAQAEGPVFAPDGYIPKGAPNPLYGRIGTVTEAEVLAEFGGGSRLGGWAGSIGRTMLKSGNVVRWSGGWAIGGVLAYEAMKWFYEEVKRESGGPLDDWWNGPAPDNIYKVSDSQMSSIGWAPESRTYVCTDFAPNGTIGYYERWTSKSGTLTDIIGSFTYPGGGTGIGRTYGDPVTCRPRGTSTLAELAQSKPGALAPIPSIISQYLDAHPALQPSIFTPRPNANEMADDVVDPGLDTDGDGVTDGDELRMGPGVVTNPGNRPHPGDGPTTDPADPASKPVDTDGDGIPDWRDGDDDNDGFQDDEETPQTQKDPTKTPITEKDTDHDGIPDYDDPDDDGDGWSDQDEEAAGSDPKNPASTPPDQDHDGVPDYRDDDRDGDGIPNADEIAAGSNPDDPNSKPGDKPDDPKPPVCGTGYHASTDGKSCTPDTSPPKCKDGEHADTSTPPKCVPDEDGGNNPVADDCGDFSVKRLVVHTGHYLRDVVFPCDDQDWTGLVQLVTSHFPFSVVASMSHMFDTGAGSSSSNPLPVDIGPFHLDWSPFSGFFALIKAGFRAVLWWGFFTWLANRLSGQVVLS